MLRALKFTGLLIVNVGVALVGTAIIDTAEGKLLPTQSLGGILWKEWILSIICAASIGFGVWRTWRTAVAKWTWVIPTAWFGIRLFFAIGSGQLWSQFSGTGCADGINSIECRNFFVFTIPLIRGVSYSGGAYMSSLVSTGRRPAESPGAHSAGA